ncbi:MAG: response regulator [Thermodesulfobacteriota bacterium]
MDQGTCRIMVVDDEPEVSQSLASTLSLLTGQAVEPYEDPYLALQAFLKMPYDLVITDISMPRIDGYELIRRMRALMPACDFIVVTAHRNAETVQRARVAGAARLFFKPVDVAALEAAVGETMARHDYWARLLASVTGG